VYIVDTNERPNLNSGRPPSTHLISDDTDCIQAHAVHSNKCTINTKYAAIQSTKSSIYYYYYWDWLGGLATVVVSFIAWTKLSTLSPIGTGMGDHIRAGIPRQYVTKPTMLTQPYILLGSLNWVPALISWRKGGNVTSAGWQVTLCDLQWHVSFHSGEAH